MDTLRTCPARRQPVLSKPGFVASVGAVGVVLLVLLGVMDARGSAYIGCPVEDDRTTCAEVIGR